MFYIIVKMNLQNITKYNKDSMTILSLVVFITYIFQSRFILPCNELMQSVVLY